MVKSSASLNRIGCTLFEKESKKGTKFYPNPVLTFIP
jgi:hypothetical protein